MSQSQLIYVTDPLCLWCYGIAPTLTQFYATLPENMEKITINGGLFPAERARIADPAFRDYLKNASVKVTELTGQTFSEAFWNLLATPGFKYDTQPSARATVIVKSLSNEQTMREYMHQLQVATFVEGQDPTDEQVLATIATEFGIVKDDFLQAYADNASQQATQDEYAMASQMGVRGFPAILYVKDNQGYSLVSGFAPLDHLTKALAWAMDKAGEPPIQTAENSCDETGCKI
ncbi:DsbA family protein [Aliikangiella maris]|uniref:DsbA family protein n=2 Tax=Aliikangiella maris TaxID=3162458 RepID=A0ABV2BT40_9GAMM